MAQDITATLTTGCMLVSALRMHEANKRISGAFILDPQAACVDKAKATSAWLPPRHRSITTPFNALETWKLLYQANVHGYIHAQQMQWTGCWCQCLYEAIGKSFQVNQVGVSSLEMCALRLNWMTIGQLSSNRPNLPVGIKSWHKMWNIYHDSNSTVPSL